MNKISILIIDNYDFFSTTLTDFLNNYTTYLELQVIDSISDLEKAFYYIANEKIDLILIDMELSTEKILNLIESKKITAIFYTIYDFNFNKSNFNYPVLKKMKYLKN